MISHYLVFSLKLRFELLQKLAKKVGVNSLGEGWELGRGRHEHKSFITSGQISTITALTHKLSETEINLPSKTNRQYKIRIATNSFS